MFQSIADIQGSSIASRIQSIGCYAYVKPGDLLGRRGRHMYFTRITAPGSSVMPYVQSNDGGWWVLANRELTPQMFGAFGLGDRAHDDYPAIAAMLAWANANTIKKIQTVSAMTIHFPLASYYSSQTINITTPIEITAGLGSGLQGPSGASIQFPIGVGGIVVAPIANRTSIKGLALCGTYDITGAHAPAHGLLAQGQVFIDRMLAYGWSGDGFQLDGTTGLGYNVDSSTVERSTAQYCAGNGFNLLGGDANCYRVSGCCANNVLGFGILDSSAFGGLVEACETNTCGVPASYMSSIINGALALYNGVVYAVRPIFGQASYPLTATTPPGTNPAVWMPTTLIGTYPMWTPGMLFAPGGPYCSITGPTPFVGCYAEEWQPPSLMNRPGQIILGEHASPVMILG